MSWLEIFLFSVFSSFVSPILGIGGGLLNVPFLTLYVGAKFANATTASLLAGICVSVSASLYNMKRHEVNTKMALGFLLPILLGASLSAYVPLPDRLLYLLFGALLLPISYMMFIEHVRIEVKHKFLLACLLFLAGLISGLFGIGAGILFVPLLMCTQGCDIKIALATSSFMIVFVMLASFLSHLAHGDLDAGIAIPLALPALFMGYAGAYVMVERMAKNTLRKIFSVFLLFVTLLMWSKALG